MEEVRGGKYLLLVDDLIRKYFHNWLPERRFVGILDQQERLTIRLILIDSAGSLVSTSEAAGVTIDLCSIRAESTYC